MAEDRRSRRQALALAYGEGDGAPRLVAKGYGEVAERIIAEAQRSEVPIHDSPELVGLLMQLDLDAQIPPQLYQVV
ncbi:MAG TPA: EscU/YscU/HrcU family type III secretion system export apparatus switch protein, partial [Pseudomonas sp.]